jgi:hypothetical protein
MALFETEEVNGNSPYVDLKIGDQDNGYKFGFLFLRKDSAVSPEYGRFDIWQGVSFDPKAETEEQLMNSLALASFVPNTMLLNFEKNGAFAFETPYILTKKWTKGDKYEGNKRAKGHGWGVEKVKLPTSILDKMLAFHNEKMSVVEKAEDDAAEETPQQDAPKNASGVKM